MEFTKQAIQSYYLVDHEQFLNYANEKFELMDRVAEIELGGGFARNLSPEEQMSKALAELDRLTKKYSKDGKLDQQEMDRFRMVKRFIDEQGNVQKLKERIMVLSAKIENYKSASLFPVAPSAKAIKRLMEDMMKKKAYSEYLSVEVVDFNEMAGGVVKISGLNRVIEKNLPGLDIYFVGIDHITPEKVHLFGTEGTKIFVAARMRDAR